tara:strand:+ start:94 stop:792 length:699 start_codon:yes stop_codon:yes gene_type:complete
MRKGFEYFDKVFVINLDIRKDRLKRRYEFFESQGISDLVERYAATRPNEKEYQDYIADGKINIHTGKPISIGEYGCISSHLNIIKMAKKNNWESVLVLEDDVEFINTTFIDDAVEQLKSKEWNLFYLGSNTHEPLQKESNNLLRLKKGYATHALAYHKRFYDQIINAFDKKEINVIDVWLAENAQDKLNCYCSYPITAIQENDFSDIHNAEIDYSWMIGKFEENTKHIINNG